MESESSRLLKEEINKTTEVEYDLAKWKLLVTAALGGAAIGVGQNAKPGADPQLDLSWLLLLIPFVCAYIDLYAYQNALRVLVISKFLGGPSGENKVLQAYEQECARLRREKKKVFALASEAGIASSVGLSVIAPALYVVIRDRSAGVWKALCSVMNGDKYWIFVVWLCGVLLIVGLRLYYHWIVKKLPDAPPHASQVANTGGK